MRPWYETLVLYCVMAGATLWLTYDVVEWWLKRGK